MMTSANQNKQLLPFSLAFILWITLSTGNLVFGSNAEKVNVATLEKRIESATTADDHKAIAAFYREQATAARAKARKHESMALIYRNKASKVIRSSTTMTKHCNRLVDSYQSLAEDLSALAQEHEIVASRIK